LAQYLNSGKLSLANSHVAKTRNLTMPQCNANIHDLVTQCTHNNTMAFYIRLHTFRAERVMSWAENWACQIAKQKCTYSQPVAIHFYFVYKAMFTETYYSIVVAYRLAILLTRQKTHTATKNIS